MRTISKALLILAVLILFALDLNAQDFTKIVQNYNCARFSNGRQFLVSKSDSGFTLASATEVKESFARQRRVLVQRRILIEGAIKDFKRSRIKASSLLSSVNKNLKKLFGEQALPREIPPSEIELRARELATRIKGEISILDTIRVLISECESGINVKKGAGTLFSPTVEVVAVAHSRGIEGGIVVHTAPQRVQFSSKPGGYNACLKVLTAEGNTSGSYIGMGRDSNRCFPTNFDDLSPSQCLELVPEGRVGWVIQLVEYNFLNFPGVSTEELLDRMRLEVRSKLPAVALLGILKNTSRENSIRTCQSF